MRTQRQDVLEYLERHGSMTRADAFYGLGVAELSSRIGEIEADGWTVPRETVTITARNGRKVRVTKYKRPHRNDWMAA